MTSISSKPFKDLDLHLRAWPLIESNLSTQNRTGPNLNTQNCTGPNVMCAWGLTKSKSPLNKIPARVTLLVVKLGHKALIRAMIDIFQFLLINTLPTYYSLNISEITNVSIT